MKWGLVIASSRQAPTAQTVLTPERDQINHAFSDMRDDPYHGDVQFLRGLGRRVASAGSATGAFSMTLSQEHKVIVVTAVKRRGSNTY